jgi:hypothetical protein
MSIEPFQTMVATRAQFERFKSGELAEEWFAKHPLLFDDDDIRVARTQAKQGLHFYEWLSALTIYLGTGFLSLIESYEFKVQKRKQRILRELVSADVWNLIHEPYGDCRKAQCPDLLCFDPTTNDWFFCEVKGPTDKMRIEQQQYFALLEEASQKQIRIAEVKWQH